MLFARDRKHEELLLLLLWVKLFRFVHPIRGYYGNAQMEMGRDTEAILGHPAEVTSPVEAWSTSVFSWRSCPDCLD